MTEATGADLPRQLWTDHDGTGEPAADKFAPIRPREFAWVKPDGGGMWTSSIGTENGWLQWCMGEEFDPGDTGDVTGDPHWLLEPDPEARVYVIERLPDLVELVDRYTAERSYLPVQLGKFYPDWPAIAEDYDAVHLTAAGQWATRLSHPLNLYGWDCESTLWFRWRFLEARPIPFRNILVAAHPGMAASRYTLGAREARRDARLRDRTIP